MKHCFWRLLAAIALSLILITSLLSCGSGGYREVKSKRAWRKTVLTIDGEDVSFELLRFYFFRHTAEVDGGDASLWESDGAAALTEKALKLAVDDICELYAVFAVCRDYGIDPEGDTVSDIVDEYIKCDVDGGYPDGNTKVIGNGGDYDKYLESLKALHMTDTVNRLHHRYAACLKVLDAYIQNGAEGKANATAEDLQGFLQSNRCAHANYAELQKFAPDGVLEICTPERALKIYEEMKDAEGNLTRLGELVTRYSTTQDRSGRYYSRYEIDPTAPVQYDFIASLAPGEVSELIETEDCYRIYYGMEKDAAPEDIKSLYLAEEYMYSRIAGTTLNLATKIEYQSAYHQLTYAILSEEA